MSKIFLNFLIVAIAAILPASHVYAKPTNYSYTKTTQNKEPKTAIIRVTSTDPRKPNVKLDGSILLSTYGKESTLTDIHTTTPWEITVTDEYVRYVLKTDLQNPMIQVQTFERTTSGDENRVTASGHVFDGIETNCNDYGCITSGITVPN